jgi:hypothetical protein
MVDEIASHRLKCKENTDVVLVPQPADDPNDPLNWPYLKKITALFWAGALACVAGWVVGGCSSGIPGLMNEFGTDLHTTTNAALNWPVLMLGIGV